ncbi:MAG: prepilin-type N-terminal cleavage/methylation domain-containing protein, partial [Candidatus Omnitrophica bacterium]|nr:prepilin-type N-terminal cleavage/methylation domain-containing protein [Candidatus Omnitrophota bacterium]
MNKSHSRNNGFTLVETMVVVALLSVLVAATYGTFLSGQMIWNKTSYSIELDEQLHNAAQRIQNELKWTGHDAEGKYQLTYITQSGINQSDVFEFSIPVICQTGGNPVDGNGNTAHWGAPLTWGCTRSSCMDQDNNCD